MPISAAIIGRVSAIGSIGSAVIGSNAAKDAANTQAQAVASAQAQQEKMFETAQAAQQPYNDYGQGAMKALGGLYGVSGSNAGTGSPTPQSLSAFTLSPDYQFALQQDIHKP